MKKFRFRNFQIHKDSREFGLSLKNFSGTSFPKEERFALKDQLWRAADSTILNIAEGADRGTDKDFAHFLNTAHTSLNEVVACLDIALDQKYINLFTHADFLEKAEILGNQITAFRKTLLEKPSK